MLNVLHVILYMCGWAITLLYFITQNFPKELVTLQIDRLLSIGFRRCLGPFSVTTAKRNIYDRLVSPLLKETFTTV